MKKRMLFWAFAGLLTACQREADIQPSSLSLASEVAGTYRTNFYLDPSCVAIPAGQMPVAELKAESDDKVTVVYTKLYPAKTSQFIEHVSLAREAESVQLRLADSTIGTLQTDRVFTNNGMEKQGQLLRLSVQNNPQLILSFAGYKQ
jgi:hypothetical protein